MKFRFGFVVLAALVLLGACADGDAVLHVNLRTDYAPMAEWSEARVFLTTPSGQEVHIHTASAADYVEGLRVRSFEGLAEGAYDVRAELVTPDGRILGSRRRSFSLAQETVATVLISRSCAGVMCPTAADASATECSGGRCVSPECSEETTGECTGGCVADSDCVATAACASGVCTPEGACLFTTMPGACGTGEFCDSTVGCVAASMSDAGAGDSSTPDTSIPDAGPPDDVGFDAGAPSCDMPCDTGNPCELGVFDCSSGMPVCVSAGPGNAGVVCREAAGDCDAEESCDGVSADCPADERIAAGTECRADAGECDVAELCDGTSPACPLDEFEPIGTPCSDGSCDETHTCSDTCSAGASCTPADNCRQGEITCPGGVPTCVAMGNVADGTECASTEFGTYSSCGMFDNMCDETGQESRPVTMYTCQSGSCTSSMSTESRSCMRGTEGASCGSVSMGAWSACGMFSGMCDETGSRTRTVTTPLCSGGSCSGSMSTETGSCSRDTDGDGCGTVSYGSWGACGGFANACDTTGTQSRSVMTPTCGSGTCGTVTSSESRSCTRSTNGDSCGNVTYGSWGACGGFSNDCDTTGTRSRSVFTPTCSGGSCGTVTTSQSEACTRSTNGDSCGNVTYGSWSACGGFANACDTTGTRSRSVFTPTCGSGSCSTVTTTQNGSCTRSTNGDSCGTVTYGAWSACGGFANACDTTGTRSRSVFTPTCGSGSCSTVTTTQNGSCTRSTNGDSCGTVTYGAWSACGGFSSVCDNTGTRSRSVFTPTCGSGSCSTVTTTQNGSCTRNTNGNNCDSNTTCQFGTCSGGSCNLVGSPCNSPNFCCEPGICIDPTSQGCP